MREAAFWRYMPYKTDSKPSPGEYEEYVFMISENETFMADCQRMPQTYKAAYHCIIFLLCIHQRIKKPRKLLVK